MITINTEIKIGECSKPVQLAAGGDKVHLILRVKAHLSDLELWELMEKHQEQSSNMK